MIALAAFAAALLSGCVKESFKDCVSTVTLQFSYTLNLDDTDKFDQQVSYVDLFIYNEQGTIFRRQRVQVANMTIGPGGIRQTTLQLPKGEYTVVAWGNLDDNDYDTWSYENLSQMRVDLALDIPTSGIIHHSESELFHGIIPLSVDRYQDVSGHFDMVKNSNDICVVLYLDNPTLSADFSIYDIEISGCNGSYNADNSKYASSQMIHYFPYTSGPLADYTPGYHNTGKHFEFRTLRLLCNDDLYLTITEAGTVKYREKLTDLIAQVYPSCTTDRQLDRRDDYTLAFTVDSNIILNGGGDLDGEDGGSGSGGGDLDGDGQDGGNGSGGGDLDGQDGGNGSGGGDLDGEDYGGPGGNAGGIGDGGTLRYPQ